MLGLDLHEAWRQAFERVDSELSGSGGSVLLATEFEKRGDNAQVLKDWPVQGVHIDLVRAPDQLESIAAVLAPDQILSVGLIDGRNIWRSDLDAARARVEALARQRGDTDRKSTRLNSSH